MTKLLDDLAEFAQLQKERESMDYGPDRAHAYEDALSKAFHLLEDHAAEIERNAKDERQRLPAGWKIEVRYIGDRAGLCVMGPPEAGGFAIDGQTKDPSDIRDSVIRALGDAMRGGGE